MHHHVARQTAQDLNQLKLAGWALACAVACAWGGWVSLEAIQNAADVGRVEEREEQHYGSLRADVDEIKTDVKQLLQHVRNTPAGSSGLAQSGGVHVTD